MRIKSRTNCRAATESGHRSPRRARLSLAIATLATPALVGGVALAAPAAASSTSVTTAVTSAITVFQALDVSGASTQQYARVIDWWSSGAANQQWEFVPLGYDAPQAAGAPVYEIVNQNSGQCLTTDGIPGDQLYQSYCFGLIPGQPVPLNQAWATNLISQNGEDFAYSPITSALPLARSNDYDGLCIDVYGHNALPGVWIDAYYCNGQDNQEFSEVNSAQP